VLFAASGAAQNVHKGGKTETERLIVVLQR